MLGQSITRNSVLLALFALSTTALIASTYLLTKDNIALQMRQAEEKALLEIIPRSRHDNEMLDDIIPVGPQSAGLGLWEEKHVYVARQGGEVVASGQQLVDDIGDPGRPSPAPRRGRRAPGRRTAWGAGVPRQMVLEIRD